MITDVGDVISGAPKAGARGVHVRAVGDVMWFTAWCVVHGRLCAVVCGDVCVCVCVVCCVCVCCVCVCVCVLCVCVCVFCVCVCARCVCVCVCVCVDTVYTSCLK